MATPGIYKNFEAEGEIGPYVIVTHGTADYAVKAATGATVALVGTTDELGKLSNGRVDVCTVGIPEVALGGTVAAALYLADREVEILRVHDVRQVSDALSVWDKLR